MATCTLKFASGNTASTKLIEIKRRPSGVKRHFFATPQTTHVVDSNLCLGRRLHEGAVAELAREIQPLVLANHALVLKVALVAHQHHWHVVGVLKAKKFLL